MRPGFVEAGRRSEGLTGTNATLANLDHNGCLLAIRSRCPAACGFPDDLQAAFVTIAFHNVAIQLIAAALGNISLRQSLIHHDHPYRPKPKEAPDLPSAAISKQQERDSPLNREASNSGQRRLAVFLRTRRMNSTHSIVVSIWEFDALFFSS
jgi:hypothetical protein